MLGRFFLQEASLSAPEESEGRDEDRDSPKDRYQGRPFSIARGVWETQRFSGVIYKQF